MLTGTWRVATPLSLRASISRWLLMGALIAIPAAAASGQELVAAAEAGDAVRLKRLLEQGSDPNEAQPDGMTALHWAVYQDREPLVRMLLESGADPTLANRYGVLPLATACINGNSAVVRLLLDAGAEVQATLRGGETMLMLAARTGRTDAVRELLARGAAVQARERRGQTALMWAAAEGHAQVVQQLLDAGSDVNATLPSGFSPLFFAVREGRADAVGVLLKAGADVNGVMQPERAGGKRPRAGTSPLLLAVENGHFELAVALLEAGADPNDQRSGYTALHALSWVRKPNRGDGEDGNPPPRGSGNLNSLGLVRELVAHGADINARLERHSGGGLNRQGATPFLMAAVTADAPLMRTLVELGADPLLANADGSTPLMVAAGVGTRAPGEEAGTQQEVLEAIELCRQWGGDVNAVDAHGETAMHGAAYKNLPGVVRWLAEHGADPRVWNRKNQFGWTPVRIAEGYRHGNFKPSPETLEALQAVLKARNGP